MALPNTSKTAVEIVFGCMTFGEEGKEQSRIHDLQTCQQVLDVFKAHGHNELDTARFYGGGTSEQFLGKMEVQTKQGFKLATKVYPVPGYEHTAAGIRKALTDSLAALKVKKVDIYYLHAPDRDVPFIDTCRAMNELHKEGLFDEFGVSNYMAWEVAEIVYICRTNNWIQPTIYQGIYNCLTRSVEPELFPCLRKFGLKFYAFNPLVGGFITGKFTKESTSETGGRFDPNRMQGKLYRSRFWNDAFFEAVEHLKPVAQAHNISLVEIALRWMVHHSALKKQHGDKVIIGASSVAQLTQNLEAFEKGPLDQEILAKIDEAWEIVKGVQPKYFHERRFL